MEQGTEKGEQVSMLYAGPLPDAKIVLPMGEFRLFAEIHEEAGAYAVFDINKRFPTYMPDQQAYEAIDLQAELKKYADNDSFILLQIVLQFLKLTFPYQLNRIQKIGPPPEW